MLFCCIIFFFFKQKTAYEMRISDWSSDVCSSDLLFCAPILGVAVWWLPRQFEFLVEMAERLAFAARAGLLIMLWVMIGVGTIARLRRKSAQDTADRKSTRLNSSH